MAEADHAKVVLLITVKNLRRTQTCRGAPCGYSSRATTAWTS